MSGSMTVAGHESTREVCGWRFSCHKASAMSSAQRDEMAAELRLRPAIPLPEVVFADSTLQIEHQASGLVIHFGAKEALHTWMRDHDGAVDQWEPSSFDFTYSTSYNGSVFLEGRSPEIIQTSETLPLAKLQQQVAILFYERVLLFEDDIRDLGEIYVEVRVVRVDVTASTISMQGLTNKMVCARKRVMEFGFLLLCRYYCRIDEKTVKLQDTRYYHEFADNYIWRDHERRESTTAEVKQILSARHPEQQDTPFELSGDFVYGLLRPISSTTEKIYLTTSS